MTKKLPTIYGDNFFKVQGIDGIATVDSTVVADIFANKRHDHVLGIISNLIERFKSMDESLADEVKNCNLSNIQEPEFRGIFTQGIPALSSYFIESTYLSAYGTKKKCYRLTKKGFSLVVFGLNSKKAFKYKIAYIEEFEKMESYLKERPKSKSGYKELTATVKDVLDNPCLLRYAEVANMINKLVIGMTSQQFKDKHDLRSYDLIRNYMSSEQVEDIVELQKAAIILLSSTEDVEETSFLLKRNYKNILRRREAKKLSAGE